MAGWMDRAHATGVHPERLLEEGVIDILDTQLYGSTADVAGGLRRIESDIKDNLELYQNADEMRFTLAGTSNGVSLSIEEREEQLKMMHQFKEKMAAQGVDVRVGIFDSNAYIKGE